MTLDSPLSLPIRPASERLILKKPGLANLTSLITELIRTSQGRGWGGVRPEDGPGHGLGLGTEELADREGQFGIDLLIDFLVVAVGRKLTLLNDLLLDAQIASATATEDGECRSVRLW